MKIDTIREIYHLPNSVAERLLYCRNRDGELGIPRVTNYVMFSALRLEVGLRTSRDPELQEVAEIGDVRSRAVRAALDLRDYPDLLRSWLRLKIS